LSEGAEKTEFDWVAERSACTLPKMFRQLREEIEGDVKERNAQRPDNSPYEFLIEDKDSSFVVVLHAADYRRTVTFLFEDHAIIVLDPSGNQMFEVTLLFTDEGKCRLRAMAGAPHGPRGSALPHRVAHRCLVFSRDAGSSWC